MQVSLLPGSIGPVLLTDAAPIARRAITPPFLTTGLLSVGVLVELDPQVIVANVNARACYRFWATDNSDSATAWTAFGAAATAANRKQFVTTTNVAGSGNLMCQLGLEVELTGAGAAEHARAYLRFPAAVY